MQKEGINRFSITPQGSEGVEKRFEELDARIKVILGDLQKDPDRSKEVLRDIGITINSQLPTTNNQ